MPTFRGTNQTDYIVPDYISAGVTADPAGTTPGAGADTIYGNKGADYLDGGAGNDWLYGGQGADSLFGGDGNDYLTDYNEAGIYGNNVFDGGAGNDTLAGGNDNDSLLGGSGNDYLYGYGGSDTLDGGTGADTMDGGSGGDVYYVDNSSDVVSESDTSGNIYWYYDRVYASTSFTLGSNIEDLYLTGSGGYSGVGNDGSNRLYGNSGNNALFGLDGDDYILGADGSDTIDGGSGNDDLVGEGGNDHLFGGGGNDYLVGDAGADTLAGGAGDDRYFLSADDGGDVLVEDPGEGTDTIRTRVAWTLGENFENLDLDAAVIAYGNDRENTMSANGYSGELYALGGNDTLEGGWGSATLAGGSGDDLYVIYEDGAQTIVESAEGGTDTVDLAFGYWGGGTYVLADNVENINVSDGYYWSGYYYGDIVYTDSYITANSSANTINGGGGDNTILGMNGTDTIYGNDGDDTFDGGGGADYLDGGAGSDTVLYLFTSNKQAARVDLAAGRVSFPGQTWGSETLVGIENAQTGAGNDVFIGNAAANRFDGGGGNDTFDGAGGTDYFNGGAGIDTVLYTSNTTSVNVNLTNQSVSFPGQSWPSESFAFVENASTGSAADTLAGSSGANELHGMGGGDRLVGAAGADRLVGGAGNDVFVFLANDSTTLARDVIAAGDGATAFQGAGAAAGDRIDLSGYDADTTRAGVQDWAFGTSHAKGHLWVTTSGSQTILNGNVDNDAAIEFQVAIDDASVAASAYKVQDFIL